MLPLDAQFRTHRAVSLFPAHTHTYGEIFRRTKFSKCSRSFAVHFAKQQALDLL